MRTLPTAMLALGLGALLAQSAAAGIQSPLHIGTTNAVRNERGQLLAGTDPAAALFNQPVVDGDIVQVIRTYNGVIDPPDVNGQPVGTNNVIIATSRIGRGVDPSLGTSGQFGMTLTSYEGGPVFVRVFNAPSVAASSFYGNSQIYTEGAGYSVFMPVIGSVQPLDSGDPDGDALINSWEKSMGSNPNAVDSDGDGIGDNAEVRSGTDANDPFSYLSLVQVLPNTSGDAIVFWASVAGKSYQVQAATNDLTEAQTYVDIGGPVTATSALSQVTHTNGLASPTTHYRVKLVE